ncbi:MAG: MCE family protein [Desulfobacterales bacterium]|nr:MCE family protein [Desulfobacterales bacterium]
MNKRTNKAMIGGFVLGAVGLAVAGILVFGSGSYFSEREMCVMYFKGSVKGLNVGAPLLFRGVKVGSVKKILVRVDNKSLKFRIPVFVEFERDRITNIGGKKWLAGQDLDDAFNRLLNRGLRAQLEIQSMVTGQLIVSLDFYPDSPLVLIGDDPDYREIPTIQSSLEELVELLEKAPVEEIFGKLLAAMEGIEKVVNSGELHDSIHTLNAGLKDVRKLVKNMDDKVSLLSSDLHKTLADAQALIRNADGQITRVGADIGAAAKDVRKLVNNMDSRVAPIASGVEETLGETRNLVRNVDNQIAPLAASLIQTSKTATRAIVQAEKTLESIRDITGEETPTINQVHQTLEALSTAARSIQLLANYLERHPEALLKGRGGYGGD